MSILHPVLKHWWKGDRKILYIFALYGLAAGIMTSALSLYNDSNLTYVVLQLNFSAMLITLYIEWNVANPLGFSMLFHPAMLVVGSMAAWSFIGLLIYSFVRMFRMGP